MSHGHHCHGGCDHSQDDVGDPAISYGLYQKIDLERVQCFNEHEEGAGQRVFKPWDERLDVTKFVKSDVDEELLFYIPFTGSVKLKGLVILGGEERQHPRELRLFKNRQPQGFDQLGGEPEQVLAVSRDDSGTLEYPIKASRFNGVTSLVIHIPGNYGDDTTIVYYIGLRGDFTKVHRHEVTIATYEASPNPSDHKTENFKTVREFVS